MPGSLQHSSSRRPVKGYGHDDVLHPRHLPWTTAVDSQCATYSKETGIVTKNNTRCSEKYSSPAFRRRKHSLCHLPNCDSREESSPTHLLVRRVWNGSDLDLPASLEERKQREPGEREMGYRPGGHSREPQERNLDLELNMMQFELFSLKQKMESSFAHLEKEKKWLEKNGSEDRNQGGDLEDNNRKPPPPPAALDSDQKGDLGKENVVQELTALQESLATHKKRIKALEAKQKEMVQHLNTAQEEKVELNQEVQRLTLELQCTQKKQEGISDQVSVLHSELLSTRSQMNHQEKEAVLMKEELESTRQEKQELSSEVAKSHRRLEELLEKVHHLEAEKTMLDNCTQPLENELLQEKEECLLQNQAGDASLQESCEHLRECQTLLEKEKRLLQAHCLRLEEASCNKREEIGNQLAEQQKPSQSWRNRWEQVAADMKGKEEQLAEMCGQSQAVSTKAEASALLQIQLDACKQELELERNRSRALHDRVRLLESVSRSKPVPPKEEANPRLELLREELQKARDMLKARNVEAEEQQKELESTRSQFAECISQKERLEQLVTSLEKQLDEKEQALRDLRQAKDADRTQRENKMSSFELKGRHQEWEAKTTPSPWRDQESLKVQHQLVTEQLKGLFRQRGQRLQQAPLEKNPLGSQEQTPLAPQTSQGLLTAPESFRFPKSQPASMNIQYSKGEEHNLQEQLKEKTQIISTMASEIQDLKQKNENLMQAKLRFQQQIQDIRRLSKRQPESSSAELAVPRLHSLAAGLQSAQGSDNSLPSAQSDELVLSRLPSQKDLGPVPQEPERSTNAGTQQSSSTSDAICALVPALALQSGPSLSAPSVPSIKLSPRSVTSLQDSESEGPLLSPRDPTLLSPRPFASPRPWSPFKSQGSPEPPED
ncbi:hypothetical protein JRQ81_006754 [Phrynocephalus forsythii]|uniref:Uncharacterized protein n=1 Tax=Phrynocephalus forsythii TaxID=171643 RepID=A0A9Q1AU05_9SAUR|nr:hypothetical protein JRQ81_006754 [Phrynocephalus forsythii]